MRGRKPVPIALKILRGTAPHRPLTPAAPQWPALAETLPLELADDPLASAEWQRLMPLLRGCATEGDRSCVLAACQQWSLYLRAQQRLDADGILVVAANHATAQHPAYLMASKALGHCEKLWPELGLTPTSRSRVRAVAPPKSADERARNAYFDGRPPA